MSSGFSGRLRNFILLLCVIGVVCTAIVITQGWERGSATIVDAFKKQYASTIPSVSSAPSNTARTGSDSAVLGAGREHARVVRVVDGDTIEIEGNVTVRYIGVDTPETVKVNTSIQCFGKEASNRNKELVEGQEIEMEKDVSNTDRYGRLLRYVYVKDVLVNQLLVQEGYAYAITYRPDIKYQHLFAAAQKDAQDAKRGLWSSCDVESKKRISTVAPISFASASPRPFVIDMLYLVAGAQGQVNLGINSHEAGTSAEKKIIFHSY